jgi:hypothetical protein
MRSKYIAKKLIFILLIGSCATSIAAPSSPAEFTDIFSNWKVYSATGDCGGQTLTLVRDNKARIIRGYLQTYEGNCEDTKTPIENIQLNSKKRGFSFTAATYVQDGKGGLEISAERRFRGTLGKTRVKGEIEYCPINSETCNSSESVVLLAVVRGTL